MKFRGLFTIFQKGLVGLLAVLMFFTNASGTALLIALLQPLTADAAQVTIDANPTTTGTVHTQLGSALVFIDDLVGYKFYRVSTGACGYRKTTNGGASWGTFVSTDTQTDCIGISVWYDQWTPGDTGTNIHIVTIDTGNDDVFYNRLNTSGDTLLLTTATSTQVGAASTYAAGTNEPSITKATDGTLYVVTDDGNGTVLRRCSTNCNITGNWTTPGTAPQGNADSFSLLMPLASGNVMLINRSTTNVLRYSVWNGTTWSSFLSIDGAAVQNTTYDVGFAATVDTDTNDIYLAYATDNNDFVTADHDIRTAVYSSGSWTAKTDVLTNVAGRGILQVAISRNQNNGALTVGYTARSTIGTAATARVYTKTSTDGMTTWGTEQGPFSTPAGDLYGIDMNLMSYERIFASWFNITSANDLFGDTVADIGPEVQLTATGTQQTQTRANQTGVYAGGKFVLSTLSSYTVSSVVVTESGTIQAQDDLSNIKLYYEADTSNPYNCASESYAGTETQFGATADSFSGADGVAGFTNSPVSLSTTSALCFYVVYDVDSTAQNGNTIELSVANPSTDVVVSGGIEVYPASDIAISGTTTVVDPNLTQFAYHWRQDNGSQTTASSASSGVENTALTAIQKGVGRRVRIGVANQGSTSTLSSAYTLQYGEAAPTCEGITAWTNVGATGAAWLMNNSANITDGSNTTNISTTTGGVTDLPSTSFVAANAALKDTSATTSSLTLAINQFVEFEYSVIATSSATEGSTYCFRMVSDGVPLSVYSQYPRATIAADVLVQSVGTQIADRKSVV